MVERLERRIAPPRALESVLDDLCEMEVFASKQKGMMFAAALGYARGERLPLDARGNGIRPDVFQTDSDDGFMNALAVAVNKDLYMLGPERSDVRATLFEEYAHAGLVQLKKICFEQEGDPLESLLRLTLDARSAASAEIPGIDHTVLAGLL